jgi:elongator complex protein 3
MKEFVPPWVRIMRIHREFPVRLIKAGVKSGNLRELALAKLRQRGKACRCIRCREVGHKTLKEGISIDAEEVQRKTLEYEASGGKEVFISFEEPQTDALIGYVRLRLPSAGAHRPEVTHATAIVRELHVYGNEVAVGKKDREGWQHQGFGRRLLEESERYAKGEGSEKILVLSALGTKAYYRKLGYDHVGPYVGKSLN